MYVKINEPRPAPPRYTWVFEDGPQPDGFIKVPPAIAEEIVDMLPYVDICLDKDGEIVGITPIAKPKSPEEQLAEMAAIVAELQTDAAERRRETTGESKEKGKG